MKTLFLRSFTAALSCLLYLAGPEALVAQTDSSAMTGTVTDAQGAVVPGAQVKLTNTDTNFQLQTTTDGKGVYTFQPIKLGHYKLEVSAPGFSTTTHEGLEVQLNQRLGVDVSLKIGAQSEVVTVEANDVPLLQTEEASTGKVIPASQINDTPLNLRNYVFIAQLTAGVAPATANSSGQANGSFYANGTRVQQDNFILDGIDNNSNSADMLNGAVYVIKPPPDALQEFKIQTGSFSAEFGHSAGAVVNASIKSGTNKFNGNVWEYFRNDVLNAVNLLSTIGKPEYRQNQFGGTFGGPIIRSKLFFFVDTEATDIRSGNTLIGSVPTPLMRQGNFSELLSPALTGQGSPIKLFQPGSAGTIPLTCGQLNVLCPSQINPLAQKLANLYPLPNINNGLTYNNYSSNSTTADLTNQFDIRIDYNVTNKDLLFARYSWTDENSTTPAIFPGAAGGIGSKLAYSQNGGLNETHLFSPTLTNELRLGVTWGHYYNLQGNFNINEDSAFGLNGFPGLPAAGLGNLNGGLPTIGISSLTGIGPAGFTPTVEFQNVHQLLDNLTKILGNHSIKMGGVVQSIRFTELQPNNGHGSLTYDGKYTGQPGVSFTGFGLADFYADSMDTATLSSQFNSDNQRWYMGAYIQDDWKVTPRLTVNAGVRYDFYDAPYNRYDHQANFYLTGPQGPGYGSGVYLLPKSQQGALSQSFTSLLAKDNIQVQYTSNRSLINAPKLLFAPRLGLAYRVTDRLVARSGFGIFYGGVENLGGFPILGVNFPYDVEQSFVSPTCSVVAGVPRCPTNGVTLENGFTNTSLATPAFRGSDPNWKMAYTMSYNMMFEYAITNSTSLETGYVGTATRHEPVVFTLNDGAALVAPGVNINPYRPFPDFGAGSYIANSSNASYNSLQTTFKRRFQKGLTFLGTWTWSHSLDDAREPFPATGEGGFRSWEILGEKIDYSNSPFDIRHRVTATGSYELPFGAGKTFVNRNKILNQVLGGWTVTGVWTAQTGNPFTPRANTVVANGAAGGCCDSGPFPVLVGNPYAGGGTPNASNPNITCPAVVGTVQHWFNPCAFANPPLGSLIAPGQVLTGAAAAAFMGGDRSQIHGPGLDRINASIYKTFRLTEKMSMQVRADSFNIANHPSFGLPSVTISSSAGQVTTAKNTGNYSPDARFFQVAMKLFF